MKEGVTFAHIIDLLRDQEVTDDTFIRSLLLDSKDLHNISPDFNIDYATNKHKNDANSIKLWVEEMKTLEKQYTTKVKMRMIGTENKDSWIRKILQSF